MKFLISQIDTYRVDTVAEVEQLHQELRDSKDFSLEAFSYKTKFKKSQGDIIEEWQQVTAKKVFNDEKDPENIVNIEYEVN